MSDGSGNLRPWQPGESGNPAGSSQRARARAAARRVDGLADALREIITERCPESVLATLPPEQRAALDGDPSLARFLAARLVTAAASASNPRDLVQALGLIAGIGSRIDAGPELDASAAIVDYFTQLPAPLRSAVLEGLERPGRWLDVVVNALPRHDAERLGELLCARLEREEGNEA